MQDVILYATDTMADWEYGYLTTGLAMADEMQPDRFRLRVLADGQSEVTTAGPAAAAHGRGHRRGGRRPGGAARAAGRRHLVRRPGTGARVWPGPCVEQGTPVAAICGATYGLARAGLLDTAPAHQQRARLPGRLGVRRRRSLPRRAGGGRRRRDHRPGQRAGRLQCRDLPPDRAVSHRRSPTPGTGSTPPANGTTSTRSSALSRPEPVAESPVRRPVTR